MELKISSNLKKNNNQQGNNWFNKPGDLTGQNNITSQYFTIPNKDALDSSTKEKDNLDEKASFLANDMSKEEIEEYIKRHTSGKRLATSLCSQGGGRIATFPKFVEMVEDGYNIVKANLVGYVNNEYLIDVEYQLEIEKDKKIGMGGR